MKRFLLVFVAAGLALPQDAVIQTDLIGLAAEARRAVDAGDWKRAASLTSALREATISARNRAWMQANLEREDRIIAWLPADTETVAAWHEPFAVSAEPAAVRGGAETAQSYVLGLLTTAEAGRFVRTVDGRMLRLGLLAARKFSGHPILPGQTPPLGMIDYQGCAIYVFSEPLPTMPVPRPADDMIEGRDVWSSRGSQHSAIRDGSDERILLAFPEPDTAIACNDHEFLAELLSHWREQRMGERSGFNAGRGPGVRSSAFRAQTQTLWTHVDRTTPFWALRRFVPERAASDPTQPANPSVLGKADPEAVGLTVSMDGAGAIKALWISRAEEDPWRTALEAGAFEKKAQSRRVATGLWELSVSGDQRVSAPAVFALMSCLGFAVLL